MNPKADFYFNKSEKWQEELAKLRLILLGCELHEEVKWGVPCYTFQGKNVALVHVFKEYCAVLFIKGALLRDDAKLLIQQTENTQAARQLRFTSAPEIAEKEPILKAYIQEAIEAEKAGLKVGFKTTSEFGIPPEFEAKLAETPALQTAFNALTPGRQRAYMLYFSAPKQSATRKARIEKCVPQIFSGKGLND